MLPEEITKWIGKPTGTSVFQVEREAIRRFADSVGDDNPLYWDEEYAKKSKYGSIIAPPGIMATPWYGGRAKPWGKREEATGGGQGPNLAKAGFGRVLDGGVEWDFFKPIKAGDTITAVSSIKDITVREGRTGKMAFIIRETTYTNQKGEVICKARGTSIHPEGSPKG